MWIAGEEIRTSPKKVQHKQRHENEKNTSTCVLSRVQLFATPWTVVHQAPLLMEFSRQEYYNGVPFPTPGDLLEPGIESTSLESPSLTDRFFTISATWAVHSTYYSVLSCVYNIYM